MLKYFDEKEVRRSFFVKKFVPLYVFFACILFLIQTSCIGKGVKPTELQPQEPAKVSIPAGEQPERGTLKPAGEKPTTTAQPDSGAAKPIVTIPSEQVPKEIKQPEPGQPVPVETKKEQVMPSKVPQKPEGGSVSFNFDDADVFSVIQTIFGDVLKVNYIVDPNVKGRVNFRSVAPVAKEDVLPLMEVILRLNGIGIVEESGLYRIVPISDISKEPAPVGIGRESEKVEISGKALLQVIPIKYVQSSEMVRVLTPFLSKDALIVDVPKGNYIIVVDTDANVKRLLELVKVFDSEQLKLVTPQIFVYPVQNSKATDVASLLQQIFLGAKPTPAAKTPTPAAGTPTSAARTPTSAAKTPTPAAARATPQPQTSAGGEGGESLVSEITKIFPDEVTNSIIILATPEDYALIADTIKKIDIMPRQVVIEGLIAQVSLSDNLSFGLSWSSKTHIKTTEIEPFTKNIDLHGNIFSIPQGTTLDSTYGSGFTFVATDPSGTVRARLTAALATSKAKVLAAPHILVSDNKEAHIQVGSQVPLATSTTSYIPTTTTTTTEVLNPITSTIQYKDIGIILKVKPQINDSGLISLELSQEISAVGKPATIAGQDFSSIDKTETTTNLVARDGETIIIGGLIREDITKQKNGIPILSKIPLIGNLFSYTSDLNVRTELIILLTPHVVRNQQEAADVTSDYVRKFKASKDEQLNEFIKERREKEQPADDKGSKDSKKDTP
jgi:general secretion pathway protein D